MNRLFLIFCILYSCLVPSFFCTISNKLGPLALQQCQNAICTETSAYLRRYMRPEVNPCEDFFEFVCGRLTDPSPKPSSSDQQKHAQFVTNLRSNITVMLKGKERGPEWLEKARILYRSCIRNRKDPQSIEPLRDLLKGIYSLGKWDEILGALKRQLSFNFLFSASYSMGYHDSIDINQANYLFIQPDFHRLKLRIPALWTRKRKQASAKIERLVNNTKPLLEQLGLLPVDVKLMIQLDGVLAERMTPTEMKLSRWSRSLNEKRKTFDTVRKRYLSPHWDWENYFKLWDFDRKSTYFLIRHPMFIQGSIDLLNRLNRKYLLQYVTLLLLKFLETTFFSHLPDRLIESSHAQELSPYVGPFGRRHENMQNFLNFAQNKTHNDAQVGMDICIDAVTDTFPALTLIVLDKRSFISMDLRGKIANVAFLIKEAFYEQIKQVPWLSGSQRKLAREKLRHINVYLSYPQSQLRNEKLNELYKNLNFDSNGGYLDNGLRYLQYFGKINLQPEYREFVFTYWPFYVRLFNTVAIQGVFLQPPNFNMEWPGYMVFATVGHAIAHEMAHAFDRNGWFYKYDGTYLPRSIWDPKFQRFWLGQEKCFADHYSAFYIGHGINVNGDQTMGENIADVMGLQLAYRAYLMSEQARHDQSLPGFKSELSANQLFFVGLGRTMAYCHRRPTEATIEEALLDTHTPGKFRLLGMLRNSPEFASIFNCQRGTYMNPREKCNFF